MNAGQASRLRFIETCLDHYGTFNRGILADYFGISTPQASIDTRAYTTLAPVNIYYDLSAKTFRKGVLFTRIFP